MTKSPFQMSFPLAVEFFKKKVPLPSETWKTVAGEYQAISFVVASITKLSILQDIQELIAAQLDKGISPEAFRGSFQELMIRRGWSPGFSPYRISLILSQNVRQSMAYGRFSQQTDPGMLKRRKYWQWSHRDSVQFRPAHKALDGKVFPADSTFFQTAYPPCGFGCRCAVFALSDRDLAREGLSVSQPPNPKTIADPGFKNFPANLEQQRSQLVADAIKRLPPNLARLVQEDADFQESVNFAYNPNQPRDERGRFGSGSHAITQPKINPNSMSASEIAAYIDDASTRANRHIGDTSQGDWFLRELARDQGFDGLPHVVTKQQMDEYVANGERELFRGLDSYGIRGKTGEDLAEQFRSGELYAGNGLSGNGIYVAYGADKYDAEGYMGAESEGAMLRMTLKSKAKTISVQELKSIQEKDAIVQTHSEFNELGRYATFKGYDVIDVGASKNAPKYMVILNRTALRVQNESIKGVSST